MTCKYCRIGKNTGVANKALFRYDVMKIGNANFMVSAWIFSDGDGAHSISCAFYGDGVTGVGQHLKISYCPICGRKL